MSDKVQEQIEQKLTSKDQAPQPPLDGEPEIKSQDDVESQEDIEPQDDVEPPKDDLATKLEEAEQKAKENYDRLLRASADFENYKKRTAREMQDVVKYANEKMSKELLTVVDNLERAIEAAGDERADDDPLLAGIHLTLGEILKILERHKVQPLKALGEPFDPTYHQAMMQEEVDDTPPNTVVREMQKGYLIHNRLLRPAMVIVSKARSEKDESPADGIETEHT